MRSTLMIKLFLIISTLALGSKPAHAADEKCEALKQESFTNTTITLAEGVDAGAFKAPAGGFPGFGADYSTLPAFCRVTGSIKPTSDSDIQFELWLPQEGWNGRFMQTGNGVAAGSIVISSMAQPLAGGYAVTNTDTGHKGGGDDFSWAVGHAEKVIDYGYRAVHELTVVGKEITTAYFGKAPEKSYWNGCSTGGRQGLMEAQKFPNDYDAIIAGAPAANWTSLVTYSALGESNIGPGRRLGMDKLGLLKNTAVQTCDALDGVEDGVISLPESCPFDPVILQCGEGHTGQCLTEDEVAFARSYYAGIVDSMGKVYYPGTGPGSEQLWAAVASPMFNIGTNFYRDVVLNDKNWDVKTLNIDDHLPMAIEADGGNITAMDPDLSAFIEQDGKLILYHGTIDGLISYGNTVNYYESVVDTLGKDAIEDNVKLYIVPGMSHCSGGDGAFIVDWLGAMEAWVEEGKEPGTLQATRPDVIPGAFGAPPTTGTGFTRPLCVYPEVGLYKGEGDNTDAANFECRVP